MKHTFIVTLIFLLLFVGAQLFGLFLVNESVTDITQENGTTVVNFEETVVGDRPATTGWMSIAYILIGVLLGTLLLILLAKRKKVNFWKIWFFIAVWIAISISLGVLLDDGPVWVAWVLALALALWKIFYQNVFIQNFTELLMYGGIGVLLVPIFGVVYAIILLVLFSFYDAYAVWKSKHMVKMAEFTTDANLFPGLAISYSVDEHKKTRMHSSLKSDTSNKYAKSLKHKKVTRKTGILGGGDIIFPMLLAGAVLVDLLSKGFTKLQAFNYSLIIVAGATLALLYLFTMGKKDKFYPAMPYLTTGCLIGYGILMLVI